MNTTRSSRRASAWTISRLRLRMISASERAADRQQVLLREIRLVMPARIVLRHRNALALDRVADDGARSITRRCRRLTEKLPQLVDVVAVALGNAKAEARPLVRQRLHALDVEDAAGRLDLVVVDDRRQVGQAMLVGTGRGLPDRPFVDLAVAHQDIDLAVPSGHPRGQRHAKADGKPVAEGAGAGFDARNDRFRMAAETRIVMAKAIQVLEREEPPIGQDGVERQAAMALAQDEAVALAPVRLGRVVAQEVVVEGADDLNQGQGRPDTPSSAILDGPENQAPEISAALVQGFKLDRIEIGIVVQQSRILHMGGYTISVDPGQHMWPSWRSPLSRIGMRGAHLRRRLTMIWDV